MVATFGVDARSREARSDPTAFAASVAAATAALAASMSDSPTVVPEVKAACSWLIADVGQFGSRYRAIVQERRRLIGRCRIRGGLKCRECRIEFSLCKTESEFSCRHGIAGPATCDRGGEFIVGRLYGCNIGEKGRLPNCRLPSGP